jgi:predicted transcriptional regulator
MTLQVSADVEQLIRVQMAAGHYQTEDDLLRDALLALADRSDDIAAIQEGLDDLVAGRIHPLDEVDAEIRQRFGFTSRQ